MSVELIKLDPRYMRGKKPEFEVIPSTWICGGAIRQWFVGNEKASDVDVFGASEEILNNFIAKNCPNAELVSQTNNASTYDHKGQLVQLIRAKMFPTLADALDGFDFNVCQFGWDGKDVYATPSAVISVLRNHLGVHKILPEFAADSLRRAFKYQRKGYIPCAGTIRDLGMAFISLTPEQVQAQVEMSPSGGKRIVGID